MDPIAAFAPRLAQEWRPLPRSGAADELPALKPLSAEEIEQLFPGAGASGSSAAGQTAGGNFDGMVRELVGDVTERQAAAKASVQELLSGQNVSLHQTMIAMEEAQVSFQLMVEVRNKLLESYQELMRMQV